MNSSKRCFVVGLTVKENDLGGEGGSDDLMKRRQQIMVRAAGANQTRFMIGTSSGFTFIRYGSPLPPPSTSYKQHQDNLQPRAST